MTLLQGQIVVVTGAAGGLGSAICALAREHGARVIGLDLRADATADIRECDLLDPSHLAEVMSVIVSEHGRIDGLVCCAGGGSGSVDGNVAPTVPAEALLSAYTNNVVATANTVTAAQTGLRASAAGSVVTMGSHNGSAPVAGGAYSHYGAAKAAVHTYTRYLAEALGPDGIRANCVAPGTVLTARLEALYADRSLEPMTARKALRRLPQPAEVAGVVVFLLSSLASYVTGQIIAVDGGDV